MNESLGAKMSTKESQTQIELTDLAKATEALEEILSSLEVTLSSALRGPSEPPKVATDGPPLVDLASRIKAHKLSVRASISFVESLCERLEL